MKTKLLRKARKRYTTCYVSRDGRTSIQVLDHKKKRLLHLGDVKQFVYLVALELLGMATFYDRIALTKEREYYTEVYAGTSTKRG
jgi:hypothetical protein